MKLYLLNTLLFLICHSLVNGQVYFLDQHFNTAPTLPAGITGSTGFGSSSGVSNYGRNAPSLLFNTNNQYIRFGPWASPADQISFFHKSLSTAGSAFLVQESPDAATWSDVATVATITTGATFTGSLLSTSRYIRIVFTLVTSGQTYMDDLRIRKATAACDGSFKMLEVLINGGCGTCEGSEEFLYFQTGNQPLDIKYMELVSQTVPTGGCAYGGNGLGDNLNTNWVLSADYTASQLTYIDNLNLWAACSGVFVRVPDDNIIPSGSKVIAFTGATPTAPYNFGALCPMEIIYVIFADQLNCGGKYSNSSCATNCTRFLTLYNHQTGCVDNQQYYANSVTTTAANAYIFDGANIGYTSTANCSFLVLDYSLISFNVKAEGKKMVLTWTTEEEDNMGFYEVQRCQDGKQFYPVNQISALNQPGSNEYSCTDENPLIGWNYYRLKMVDLNDHETYSDLVSAHTANHGKRLVITNNGHEIRLWANEDILNKSFTIVDVAGAEIHTGTLNLAQGQMKSLVIPELNTGIYLLILTGDKPETTKFPIYKEY